VVLLVKRWLKVHLHEIFLFWFLALIKHTVHRPNNKAFECFRFCSWPSWHWVSFPVNCVNVKWDSTSLSQYGARLHVSWVNAEWWNLHKWWCHLRWLSLRGVSLRVDSVDVESHSTLTQLMGSLTPCWLSMRKMNQAKTGIHNQLWKLERDSI
jgi:hypothetical protein